MKRCNRYEDHFDGPSFFAGVFIAIIGLMLILVVMSAVDGDDYLIGVPEACQYAEDLCYPEYENGRWSIVEGER